MKILIVSDNPLIVPSGATVTYSKIIELGKKSGVRIDYLDPSFWPEQFEKMYAAYPEQYSELGVVDNIEKFLSTDYDHFHIASEFKLGNTARKYLINNKLKFTSAYHAHYAQHKVFSDSASVGQSFLTQKELHQYSEKVLVPSQSMKLDLEKKSFHKNMILWSRGIDFDVFQCKTTNHRSKNNLVYYGRISDEKNLEDLCRLSKKYNVHLIGDGPARKRLEFEFPRVTFYGFKTQEQIVDILQNMDVLVFPSEADTFGLVMIEAMACGIPVAGYRSIGAVDIVKDGINGYLGSDLESCIEKCFELDRELVKESIKGYSWSRCYEIFLENLVTP